VPPTEPDCKENYSEKTFAYNCAGLRHRRTSRPEPSGTVQGFLDQCERKRSDSWDRGMDTGYCDGLIEGVTSVLTVTKAVCVPEHATRGQAAAIFIAWAKRNPQEWNYPAFAGVMGAFREAWPCEK
jgi:Rap1a immunity proteins